MRHNRSARGHIHHGITIGREERIVGLMRFRVLPGIAHHHDFGPVANQGDVRKSGRRRRVGHIAFSIGNLVAVLVDIISPGHPYAVVILIFRHAPAGADAVQPFHLPISPVAPFGKQGGQHGIGVAERQGGRSVADEMDDTRAVGHRQRDGEGVLFHTALDAIQIDIHIGFVGQGEFRGLHIFLEVAGTAEYGQVQAVQRRFFPKRTGQGSVEIVLGYGESQGYGSAFWKVRRNAFRLQGLPQAARLQQTGGQQQQRRQKYSHLPAHGRSPHTNCVRFSCCSSPQYQESYTQRLKAEETELSVTFPFETAMAPLADQ